MMAKCDSRLPHLSLLGLARDLVEHPLSALRYRLDGMPTLTDSVVPTQPLVPIQAETSDDYLSMRLLGNEMLVKHRFKSHKELTDLIAAVQFGLPLVLALYYIDAPTIIMVTGQIGGVEFVWQYKSRRAGFDGTARNYRSAIL